VNEREEAVQATLHEAIEQAVFDPEAGDVDPQLVLSGWIVIYETASLSGAQASAGHLYGPREMTTWRALGLVEWARRFGLIPADEDDEDDE